MVAPSWSMLEQLWSNALGGLFGTNLLLLFGFFAVFGVFVITRMGLGIETALPFAGVLLFALLLTVPSATFVWTIFLFIVAILVVIAFLNIIGNK